MKNIIRQLSIRTRAFPCYNLDNCLEGCIIEVVAIVTIMHETQKEKERVKKQLYDWRYDFETTITYNYLI